MAGFFLVEGVRTPRWERYTRYYELHLVQDLWGDWVLTRVWGGKSTALGQIRRELCEHYTDGLLRYKIVEANREEKEAIAW